MITLNYRSRPPAVNRDEDHGLMRHRLRDNVPPAAEFVFVPSSNKFYHLPTRASWNTSAVKSVLGGEAHGWIKKHRYVDSVGFAGGPRGRHLPQIVRDVLIRSGRIEDCPAAVSLNLRAAYEPDAVNFRRRAA